MPIPENEVLKQRQEIYESPALRDDLRDNEADVLLKWGETEVERLAGTDPEDFEQTCRFLRQLLKNINRFVGQREFNDRAGQEEYMQKVQQWLPKLGYPELTMDELFAGLPEDGKDMAGTLNALLKCLTPDAAPSDSGQPAPTAKPGGLGAAFIAQTSPTTAATPDPTPQTAPTPSGGLGAALAAQTATDDEPSVDNPPKPDTIGQTLSSMLGDIFGHDKKGE
jgi:hypothetical protein